MFGLLDISKNKFIYFVFLFFIALVNKAVAQGIFSEPEEHKQKVNQSKANTKTTKKNNSDSAAKSQKAKVIVIEAAVYAQPDFDSNVLGTVRGGQVYDISTTRAGAFFKIRLKPGVMGWIPDHEIKPLSHLDETSAVDGNNKSSKNSSKSHLSRFLGPTYEWSQYHEDTMGYRPNQNISLLGLRIFGPGTLSDQDVSTDFNLLIYNDAPQFYDRGTGNQAMGLILRLDMAYLTPMPQGNSHMLFYGAGPLFKYTNYDVQIGTKAYSLQDMVIGIFFETGLLIKLGPVGVVTSAKLTWEKLTYLSIDTALMWKF